MSLLNTQAEFVEALMQAELSTDVVVPASHLAIYRNNISASLINTLRNTYPLILALLGEDFFAMAAREFIQRYPSRSGNLHDYGEYFSDFLANYQPVHHLMYLTEVAEFEWACHVIYLAPDHPPFVHHSLANFSPEQHTQLQFILHPACWLKKFHFPILDIIDLCRNNRQETLNLNKEGVNLLMFRRETDFSLLPLGAADFALLKALNQNLSLGDALLAAQREEADYPLEEKLPWLIKENILVDCYLASE